MSPISRQRTHLHNIFHLLPRDSVKRVRLNWINFPSFRFHPIYRCVDLIRSLIILIATVLPHYFSSIDSEFSSSSRGGWTKKSQTLIILLVPLFHLNWSQRTEEQPPLVLQINLFPVSTTIRHFYSCSQRLPSCRHSPPIEWPSHCFSLSPPAWWRTGAVSTTSGLDVSASPSCCCWIKEWKNV